MEFKKCVPRHIRCAAAPQKRKKNEMKRQKVGTELETLHHRKGSMCNSVSCQAEHNTAAAGSSHSTPNFCFESVRTEENDDDIADLWRECETVWEFLEHERLFTRDDLCVSGHLDDFEPEADEILILRSKNAESIGSVVAKSTERWLHALKRTERQGRWIVSVPCVPVVKRFRSDRSAKLFVFETLSSLCSSYFSATEHPLTLFDCCDRLQELDDAILAKKHSQHQAHRELLRVNVYKPFSQRAVCVFWSSVLLPSLEFPLGTGPLESEEEGLDGASHKIDVKDWRELFDRAWREVEKETVEVLQSEDVFSTATAEQMQEKYIKLYLTHLGLFATLNNGFQNCLCATGDLRLVYIDSSHSAKHAVLWERMRASWQHLPVPHTIPLYAVDKKGCEKRDQMESGSDEEDNEKHAAYLQQETDSESLWTLDPADFVILHSSAVGPHARCYQRDRSMHETKSGAPPGDGSEDFIIADVPNILHSERIVLWVTCYGQPDIKFRDVSLDTLQALEKLVPDFKNRLLGRHPRPAPVRLPSCDLCSASCHSYLECATYQEFMAASAQHARETHGKNGWILIFESGAQWRNVYYGFNQTGLCKNNNYSAAYVVANGANHADDDEEENQKKHMFSASHYVRAAVPDGGSRKSRVNEEKTPCDEQDVRDKALQEDYAKDVALVSFLATNLIAVVFMNCQGEFETETDSCSNTFSWTSLE